MFYTRKNFPLLQVELNDKMAAITLKEPLDLQEELDYALPVEKDQAEQYLKCHSYVNNQTVLGRRFKRQGWIITYQKATIHQSRPLSFLYNF